MNLKINVKFLKDLPNQSIEILMVGFPQNSPLL